MDTLSCAPKNTIKAKIAAWIFLPLMVFVAGECFADPVLYDYKTSNLATFDSQNSYERDIAWQNAGSLERFTGQQSDRLVHSWQNSGRKMDLYFTSGLGMVETDDWSFNQDGKALLSGIQYDYQNNRFLTSARFETVYGQDLIKKFRQELRLGLKSLDFDDNGIGSMFVLVASRFSDMEEGIKLQPGFQLFGDTFESEVDFDLDGEVKFNFTYRW